MMSLRARKQSALNPRNSGHVSLTNGNRSQSKDSEETGSLLIFIVIFVAIFIFGTYREFNRVRGAIDLSSAHSNDHDQITLSNPHRVLNPNFRSLLTPEEDQALEIHASDHTRYHMVFSTDCSPFQHWQSYLVFFSAMSVRQPGHVTRIASGCEGDDIKLMQDWFHDHIQGMSSRFHLHLTPRFSGVRNEHGDIVGDYKFFNKPFGLQHWMEHAEHMSLQQSDDIVILVDPDMLLLRPLTGDFSQDRDTIFSPRRRSHMLGRKVEHGLPFAQTYGFGAQWQNLDLDKIAGSNSPAKHYNKTEGNLFFPVGPPYLATVKDMYQISLKWSEFVPLVHEQYPHLLAEMFAFCIAAAHLELRHQLVDSLMISDTDSSGEGWPLIDNIPREEMCDYARHPDHERFALPSVVHMCQRYCVGLDWFFGKRRFPTDFFECDKPLLQEPPGDLATAFDFKRPPNAPVRTTLTPTIASREAFMVCFLTRQVNDAATFYKQQSCSGRANYSKSKKMVEYFRQYHPEEASK